MKTLAALLVTLTLLTSACDTGSEPAETPPPPAAGCAEPAPKTWQICDLGDRGDGQAVFQQHRGCLSNTGLPSCVIGTQVCLIPGVLYSVASCGDCPAETKGGAQ